MRLLLITILLLAATALAQPEPQPATRALEDQGRPAGPVAPPQAGGETQDPPPLGSLGPQPQPGQFNASDHLLGDLGFRERLVERGVRLSGALFADGLLVLDGPREQSAVRLLGAADAEFDLDRLIGLPDATAFARVYLGYDTDLAADLPRTIQEVDAVPAFEEIVLGELWFEQRFFDDRVRLRGGRMDANTEFAFAEYAATFVTDSAAISPTFVGIPSFLDPALGVTFFAYPGRYSFGAGVYRGDLTAPGDGSLGKPTFLDVKLEGRESSTFAIAEAGRRWNFEVGGGLPGQAKLGGWLIEGSFARLDATRGDLIGGGYLILQQALYDEGDARQGLGAFVQIGLTDETYNLARTHQALGLVYRGLLPGREDDRAGLYLSRAGLSDAAGAAVSADAETIIEATYALQITPSIIVQPDVQVILNANGDGRDAVLGVLRVAFTF